MKKSIIAALAASFVLSIAGTALAFPVDFTGDFRLQGRDIDDKISGGHQDDESFFQLRTRINFSGAIDKDTTFFGRFSARNNFGGKQNGNGQALDQYGVKGKAGEFQYAIGRQAVSLGQGTIISTGSDAVGVDNKFDGVILGAKAGAVDVNLIGGKTNDASSGSKITEWYGLDAATSFGKVKAGAAFASGKPQAAPSVNYWAVNVTAPIGSAVTLASEFAKSDADDKNKAYFVAGTYGWAKDSFTVQYNNVENNAVDQFNSGIGSVAYPFMGYDLDLGTTKYKGFTYVYSHEIKPNLSFHAIYMDLKVDGRSGSDQEIGAGVVWKF